VRSFVNLLAVLEQNPGADWRALVSETDLAEERNPDLAPLEEDAQEGAEDEGDDLTSFSL